MLTATLGSEFAKQYKNWRANAIRNTMCQKIDYDTGPCSKFIYHERDVFPVEYLFFWDEVVEDYLYMF